MRDAGEQELCASALEPAQEQASEIVGDFYMTEYRFHDLLAAAVDGLPFLCSQFFAHKARALVSDADPQLFLRQASHTVAVPKDAIAAPLFLPLLPKAQHAPLVTDELV